LPIFYDFLCGNNDCRHRVGLRALLSVTVGG